MNQPVKIQPGDSDEEIRRKYELHLQQQQQKNGWKEGIFLFVMTYGLLGLIVLMTRNGIVARGWDPLVVWLLSPLAVLLGTVLSWGIFFVVIGSAIYIKEWLYDPFPHFWIALKAALSRLLNLPFEFLQAREDQARRSYKYGKAKFYKKSAEGVAMIAGLGFLLLIGWILDAFSLLIHR
jgi:hypothetical protein